MTLTADAPTTSELATTTVVTALETIADDVVLLTLTPADGAELPAWTAGAHVDLLLGEDLVRQYSLCSSPAERGHYQVAVLRTPDSRGGSTAVHALTEGTRVEIRGPRNNFDLADSPRYVFVAGGIGITPILPMIEAAEAAGAEWELHYGGRTSESMAFRDLLAKHGDRVHLVPQDRAGLLDLDSVLGRPRPDTLVYCCGPEPLLAAVEERCASWPAGSLHLERFAAKEREDTGDDTAFDLVLERSGITVTVEPGVTAFEAMRAAGVGVLGSCLEGVCGTCEQTVLEGEVDHRDSVLDEDEQAANDCMMVCVSRACGARLVLDA
ncbi:oxidoreductase [Nocardioides sp. GY 10113]|uniref:PDR/VanB family oxidoreductase n=1 Tax=Nocardioides sp. GY 10113 TaxID=2569761 RepID=UPI0010A843DF|nr:PDR/VanB family oxidoreductase [Nocardioides sp. GY 10113]TIC87375.1 oxidoreductase [Nocardioides sp. GY 10113]